MIRILVADDHGIVRNGLIQLLRLQPDVEVVGEAVDGPSVMERVASQRPDLLILDLTMPGLAGPELIERLQSLAPDLKVVVLSMHDEASIVVRTLRAGVAGYVTKGSEASVLMQAVRTCAQGGRFIDPVLVDGVVFEPGIHAANRLSDRELEILQLIVNGQRLGEIAHHLGVSAKTISTHKMRIMTKLRIDNNADLIRVGMQHVSFAAGPVKPGAART